MHNKVKGKANETIDPYDFDKIKSDQNWVTFYILKIPLYRVNNLLSQGGFLSEKRDKDFH